jgi:hypothetical protein
VRDVAGWVKSESLRQVLEIGKHLSLGRPVDLIMPDENNGKSCKTASRQKLGAQYDL